MDIIKTKKLACFKEHHHHFSPLSERGYTEQKSIGNRVHNKGLECWLNNKKALRLKMDRGSERHQGPSRRQGPQDPPNLLSSAAPAPGAHSDSTDAIAAPGPPLPPALLLSAGRPHTGGQRETGRLALTWSFCSSPSSQDRKL